MTTVSSRPLANLALRVGIWFLALVELAVGAVATLIPRVFYDNVPWVSLVAIAVAIPFFAVGLARAFREPQRYRGRIGGTIAAVVALGLTGFFLYATLVGVRQIPASKGAPQVGSRAPDFTLPDQDGNPVTLSRVISESKPAAVVLVFYRGFW